MTALLTDYNPPIERATAESDAAEFKRLHAGTATRAEMETEMAPEIIRRHEDGENFAEIARALYADRGWVERIYLRSKKTKRLCEVCGGEIHWAKYSTSVYCSNLCRTRGKNKKISEERATRRQNRTCQKCGDPIPETRRADAIYCSRPCAERSKKR